MWEISKIISDFLGKISETFEKNSDILGATLGLFLCNSSF